MPGNNRIAAIVLTGTLAGLLPGTLIGLSPVSIALTSSQNPLVFGQPVTLTASLSPGDATGKVTFFDDTIILGIVPLANGRATFTTRLLASGSRPLQVRYSGDAQYAPVLSTQFIQVVNAVPSNAFVGTFIPTASAPTFGGPVAVGDFNGDGKTDLVVAGNGVSVLLGNGDGSFQPAVVSSTGRFYNFVAAGDFNGDGIADLAVSSGANGLNVLLGKGDGTFLPPVDYFTHANPTFVVVGDVNADGIADLVVAAAGTGTGGSVNVLLGNGDGTFRFPNIYISPCLAGGCQVPNRIVIADFNHDGKLDLALSNGVTLSLLAGNGDGTFQAPVDYAAGTAPSYLVKGDFNGDGNADLAFLSTDSPRLYVMLGNADGTFQPAVTYPDAGRFLATGDLNGDGKTDLIVGASSVDVLAGNGDGSFQPAVSYAAISLSYGVVGEFNGDGRPDLAVGSGIPALLGSTGIAAATTLTSSPNPSIYGQPLTLTASLSPATATGIVVFSDGQTVLGIVMLTGGKASLTTSQLIVGTHTLLAAFSGDTTFGPNASSNLTQIVNAFPGTVALSSTSNPSTYGQNVVLTATISQPEGVPAGSGTVTFMDGTMLLGTRDLSGGKAVLSTALLPVGSHPITAIYSGDANHLPGSSAVFTQAVAQGTVTTPSVSLTSSSNPVTLGQNVTLKATLSPATGDGIVTFYDGSALLGIKVLANGQASLTTSLLPAGFRFLRAYYSGNAGFTASASSTLIQTVNALPANRFEIVSNAGAVTGPPSAIASGDFNEDGKPDIVLGTSDGKIAVLLGNGDATFQPASYYAIGGSPSSIVAGDFDGDGHRDLAVVNGIAVNVFLGKGDGTFQAPIEYKVGVAPQAPFGLVIGDFNQDGKPDLAIADATVIEGFFNGATDANPSSISVLFGNGDGTFKNPFDVSNLGGTAIATGDFNGDGLPDLVVVSPGLYCNFVGACAGTGPGVFVVLLSNGDGTFRQPVVYPGVGNSLAIDDFNGDGKPDVAIGVTTTGAKLVSFGSITVLLGNSDGTFGGGSAASVSSGIPLRSIVSADFNGDNKQDLAVVSAQGVTVLNGPGDGTFPTTLDYPMTASQIIAGDFTGDGRNDIVATSADGKIAVLRGVMTAAPSINPGGIVNAATLKPGPIAPGTMVSVFGDFPGVQPSQATTLPLPTTLGGITTTGLREPLFFVSEKQVNLEIPYGFFGGPFSLIVNGQSTATETLAYAAASPGIFTTNSQGTGQGAILDSDYRLVDAGNPAAAGSSMVQIYCTGLGLVSNTPQNGSAATSSPASTTLNDPTVTIGGATASVIFSGLTPGTVGLYQVNVIVPEEASKGNAVPVVISMVGATSNTVTMAVQ